MESDDVLKQLISEVQAIDRRIQWLVEQSRRQLARSRATSQECGAILAEAHRHLDQDLLAR
jgi:hypothetical protein